MPNTKSAKKMVRKIQKVTTINNARRNRIRTFISKLKNKIQSGDKEAARKAFRVAQPEIHRGVTKGVLTLNKASRMISRLSAKVKAMNEGAS